jgi:hypothetical protein
MAFAFVLLCVTGSDVIKEKRNALFCTVKEGRGTDA